MRRSGQSNGFTVWLTGLPCAGKSTIGRGLQQLLEQRGYPTQLLDGDEVRLRLSKGLGFSKEDRNENISRIAYVAKLLTEVGGVAIVAAVSPYQEARESAKAEIGQFFEVYVHCPLDVCIARDVKGMYARALTGKLHHFTGLDDPYEVPQHPNVVTNTAEDSPVESLAKIMEKLIERRYVPADVMSHLAIYSP